MAVWRSGNVAGRFNEVTLRRAPLVLGWVTSLRTGKLPQYFTKPPRPTQPPTLSETGNEYQPKCGDALRLGSKGRYGSVHLRINVQVHQVKLCDPSLTRAIPERFRDESRLMIKRYTNLRILYFTDTIRFESATYRSQIQCSTRCAT